jgi:hypothetical protein
MPITIIVEDGSNVPDANSYVDVADAIAYAANRGITLPPGDETAAMLMQAMDYIETKACDFQGKPTYTDPAQSLAWPRTGVILNCVAFPPDKIPKNLIAAQVQLAIAVNAGIPIMPNATPQDYVVEETVGPITTKYADPSKIGIGMLSPILTAVDALLSNLFATCETSAISLRTVRV